MEQILDPKNWANLVTGGSFRNAAVILAIAGVALVAALYTQTFHQWRTYRQEQVKKPR